MNTVVMKRTAPVGRETAGKKRMLVGYTKHPSTASPKSSLLEKQLRWFVATLRNPGLRASERESVLLVGGEVLLDYLSRQALEEVA